MLEPYNNALSKKDVIIIVPKDYYIGLDTKEITIDNEIYQLFYDNSRNLYFSYENIQTDSCIIINSLEIENSKDIHKNRVIGVADFLVRVSSYHCVISKHKLDYVDAIVSVLYRNSLLEIIIPASYCPECNKYYILERHYEALKKQGYICCRIDTYDSLVAEGKGYYSGYQEKSILRQYGYSVSKKIGLTERERHRILDFVIDNHILSKADVIDHIEWQISDKKNRDNMDIAIEKWESDIRYVQKKIIGVTIRVNSIKVPIKRIKIE